MATAINPESKPLFSAKDFRGPRPSWCPGCGDYGLLSATTKALAKMGYAPHEVVIVSGIGCSGNFPHFTTSYGFHGTHGRALPIAMGIKLANPDLEVIVVGGDGDGFGIGAGHFVHAARRNIDLTYIVMDNQIYGLTLGQASPTSQEHMVTLTTPDGVDERRINPITLALGAGATYVARTFSGMGDHLENTIIDAIEHKGFAFIDDISPCVTFNRLNTYDWYRERIYNLDEEEGYDSKNIAQAFTRGLEWGSRIPIGKFYQETRKPLEEIERTLSTGINPVKSPMGLKANNISPDDVFNEFR